MSETPCSHSAEIRLINSVVKFLISLSGRNIKLCGMKMVTYLDNLSNVRLVKNDNLYIYISSVLNFPPRTL